MKNEPAKRKLNKDRALAYGEVTGHAHRVGEKTEVWELEDGSREFDGATTVTHEEHKPIVLPRKRWASAQVLEFDHLTQMKNPVQD